MAKKVQKLAVTRKAIMARINRKLIADEEQLRVMRGTDLNLGLHPGDYCVVSIKHGGINKWGFDLEEYARELGVLKEWETLAK